MQPTPLKRPTAGKIARLALAGALAFAVPAEAATRCANPADQQLYELHALKTEVLVIGLLCGTDKYNTFVTTYQSQLRTMSLGIQGYYVRVYGRGAGVTRFGQYDTETANARQQEALRSGSDFCRRGQLTIDEVMGLPSGNDLPAYAAARDLIPTRPGACDAPPGRGTPTARGRGR
jgi:hypothetical protein